MTRKVFVDGWHAEGQGLAVLRPALQVRDLLP
jgi:hypothetical protein